MPDQNFTPRWRATLRGTRATLWACVVASGVFGITFTPTTIVGTIGEPLTYWWTSLSAVGGLVALVAAVVGRWKVEQLAAWVALGGMLGYAITVWGIVLGGELTRSTQASVITGLCISILYRALELAAHAAKLRLSQSGRARRWRHGG